MAQHRILVPMDFTPVSDIALEHAIVVGKAFESEIMLRLLQTLDSFGQGADVAKLI